MKRIYLICFLSLAFKDAILATEPIRFAVLTDLHIVPGNENDLIFPSVIKEIEKHHPFTVFVTGDLTNQGNDAELENVYRCLKEFRVPVQVIPGNHETTWSESAGKKITELWGNDRFYIETPQVRYCGLSTGPFMRMSDGHVKAEDLHWLNNTLSNSGSKDKPIVFFCHYPMQDGLGNFPDLTNVLRQYPVELAFCGHEHRFKLYNSDSIPQVVCEALRSRKGKVGYTIVELTPDTAYCNYYTLAATTPDSTIVIDLKQKNCLQGKPVSARPEQTRGIIPNGWQVTPVIKDSASIFTGIALSNRKIIYGTSDGRIVCRKDSITIWQRHTGYSLFSTPLISGQKVIVGSSQNEILALDLNDGSLLWRIPVEAPVTCDGVIENNELYIGAGKGAFLKIDLSTGQVIWRFDGIRSNARLQGAPALSKDRVVFGAWDTYLYCLDRTTGKLCWKWNNGKTVDLFSPGNVVPVISDGKVLIVAPDRYLTILDLNDGNTLYRTNQYKVRESLGYSSLLRRAYAKTMDGELLSFTFPGDSLTNIRVTSLEIGYEHNPCPPLVTADYVYSGSRKGEVIITTAAENRFVARYKCGNSSVLKIETDHQGNILANLAEGTVWKFTPPNPSAVYHPIQ